MSVVIHPCRLCPIRAGCELKAGFRERASKCGAASITFRCPRLASELRAGRRIAIRLPYVVGYTEGNYDEPPEPIMDHTLARATVLDVNRDHSYTCVVDKGVFSDDVPEAPEGLNPIKDLAIIRWRRRRKHTTIASLLDEPDRRICGSGNAVGDDGCDTPFGNCVCDFGRTR